MIKLQIKPLSVNSAWMGKRYKTEDYKNYERDLSRILPYMEAPTGKLQVNIIWGFSSKASDIDNPCKPLIDILQKKYSFNDKNIYEMNIKKVDVKKGEEFIEFQIKKYVE